MFGGFDSIMLNDVVRVELGKSKFKILSKCALVLFSPVPSRPWCGWNMGQVKPRCSLLLLHTVSLLMRMRIIVMNICDAGIL